MCSGSCLLVCGRFIWLATMKGPEKKPTRALNRCSLLAGGEELCSAAYVVGEVVMGEGLGVRIVGCGYVGLVTGACLSHLGHRLVCVDEGERKLAGLRACRMPIYEPGLQELVEGELCRS
jgi:UDP-glucose/GDP-mannose dehydrogenase family, NAD binding domain